MDRRAFKNFLTKRSTIWTLSLCLTGIIVLGGVAAVNNARRTKDGEPETEIGQVAYLEEEVPDDIEDELFPTLGGDEEDLAQASGNTVDNADDEAGDRAYGAVDGTDAADNAADNAAVSSGDVAADGEAAETGDNEAADVVSGAASGDGADAAGQDNSDAVTGDGVDASGEAAADVASDAAAGDGADAAGSENAEEAASGNVISEQTLLDAGVSFSEENSLMWPSAGTILIDYSMDGSVYFPTLNQYKYNPALIIGSEAGNQVLASAKGIVESIGVNEETGTTLVLNIGNGYKLTYGQLKELAVSEGDVVEEGALLGYVSEPTKYYSEEGSNLYFAMTQDNTAVDPVMYLE